MTKYYFNEQEFIKQTKESSYLLGFLWGDSYLPKQYNSFTMEILSEDFLEIKSLFDKFGTYHISTRHRANRQKQTTISISNKKLKNFLIELDYDKKSYCSHSKVLNHLNDNMKRYWLRGYFDADGCIYINNNQYLRQFSFCSCYEQDWDYLSKLLTSINVKHAVKRRTQKTSKHSVIRGCGTENILNLFNYLYPNYKYDEIGLTRKYDKLIQLTKH